MKYKVGDKVIFNQDCRLAFSYIPKGKTGEITDIVDTGLTIAYRIKMKDYPNATVPTDKANEACTKIKSTNEKHNILNGLTKTDGSEGEANEITNNGNTIRPGYYQSAMGDVFDIANAYRLDMACGTAVKYILRAGKKDKAKEIEDLEKAIRSIERAIELRRDQH
jgi:hypothetical protein